MQVTDSRPSRNPSSSTLSEGEEGRRVVLGEVTNVHRAADRQVQAKIRWEWNLPYLATSLSIAVALVVLGVFAHAIQARRVAEGLSNLAKKAMAEQDYPTEVKWLSQLIAFDFRYDRALERLAIATNNSVDSLEDVDKARQALMKAMASLDETADAERLAYLRRLLIQRLLEMPASWALEAEKQILLLKARSDDSEVLRWLGLSLFIQVENGEWRARDKSRFDRQKDYWGWMSCQPVGAVLEAAEAANADAIDLKIALLSAYLDRPELFDLPLEDAARQEFHRKAQRVIEDLQLHDDGRAQWACFTFEERLNKDAAEQLLARISQKAIDRLHNRPNTTEREERKDIRPASSYWDLSIAMAQAAKLEAAGKPAESDALYQHLVTVDRSFIPETQLAELYLRYAQSRLRRSEYASALEILQQGCKETSYSSALELWELIATIQCGQGNPDEALRGIEKLDEAIRQAHDFYLATPLRDSLREQELQRLARVRWHAAFLRSQQTLKTAPSWEATQALAELLQTQIEIPGELRLQAMLQLANAYGKSELWDLEARALEGAQELIPEDKALRKRVAEAWLRAGVLVRAESQFKSADDGSFESSLQYLQVVLENQQATPPASRELERVRQLIKQTRQRLLEEKAAGKVSDRAWVFEVIELANVVDALDQAEVDLGVRSDRGWMQLMNAYRDNAELQAMAARSFAALGQDDQTVIALENLDRLRSSAPRIWLETQLQIQLQQKQFVRAKEIVDVALREQLLPELSLRRLAAKAFAEAGDIEEACRILLPGKDSEDIPALFLLARYLLQGPLVEAGKPASTGSSTDFAATFDELVGRIQELEGPSGTIGLYLEAANLFRTFQKDGQPQSLAQAARIINQVIDARPRWMEALRLAGDIQAAKGNAEEAIALYRRAIAEGDSRVVTVFQLAKQLNQLGRFSDAEFEFQRIAQLSQYSRAISEFAVGLEQRKGNYEQALDLARGATERYPQDLYAWLIHAQAALAQQSVASSTDLIDEAERCFQKANEISEGTDVSVWIAQLRFVNRFRGPAATERLVDALSKSQLSEKSRGLLIAQAYLGFQDYAKAVEVLKATNDKLPYDIDVWCAIAECYRLSGQTGPALEALERAYRLNPKRSDVARSLAIMLATQQLPGVAAPWERIASLVEGIQAQTVDARNLFYALLLVTRGKSEQHAQALGLLKDLTISSDRAVAEDALRLSMVIHRQAWDDALAANRKDEMLKAQRESQALFDILWRSPDRTHLVNDLYQHASFLLQVGEQARVAELVDEFAGFSPNNPLLLNLRFRLAATEGEVAGLGEKVRAWVGDAKEQRNPSLLAEAGRLLSEQGLTEDSLPYLRAAYAMDSQWLRPLIVGLSRAGKLEEALRLCVERFAIEPNLETISLLTDVAILSIGRSPLDPQIDRMIRDSLVKFPASPKLLELVGTLRLFEARFPEAVELLLRAEKLAPRSLMTLNNLAIAAAEIPGRELEGLARAERAIEIYGRTPDLLDTLGIVQLYCGFPDKAEASLRASWEAKADSRTLLHLIQALSVQGKEAEVRERLRSLKLEELSGVVLTPRERQAIDKLLPESKRPAGREEL
jgi:predicted Zn-dependent protease